MPSAASLIHHGTQRKRDRKGEVIPGQRSLHRGLHVHQNNTSVKQWKANPHAKRSDGKELLVHHQKIDEELKDIYTRTANLKKDNMTMQERIEQGWKDFERIGGQRPKKVVGFREHLNNIREKKKDERARASVEFGERGEFTDYSQGSALHNMKDRRVKKFVKGQVDRAHKLKRFGDPTPLKQSGTFDRHTNTLKMFNKTVRSMKREVAHEAKIGAVKQRRKGQRSMWDVDRMDLNKDNGGVLRSSRDSGLDLDTRPRKKQRR